MGKQNRQRRAAKRRRQDRRHHGDGGFRPADGRAGEQRAPASDGTRFRLPPPPPPPHLVEAAFADAAMAFRAEAHADAANSIEALVEAWGTFGELVPATVDASLLRALRPAWSNGWQPADLVRAIGRKLGAAHARLLVDLVAADAERYRHHAGADRRWIVQLEALGAERWWHPRSPHLAQWAEREGSDRSAALAAASELVSFLWHLLPLPRLCVPPDDWGGDGATKAPSPTNGLDVKVLARVRALLAKAESTTFADEGDALTAKAHQLMARHAIDRAMIDANATDPEERGAAPIGRRVIIDDPYASAKSLLLGAVAHASRCRAVYTADLGFSTVMGHEADLDGVEILYTSLLVQATTAMVAAGRHASRHHRSRRFRHSFLVAFAIRIGERLEESARATVEEAHAEHGASLVPVLAARDEAVDEAVDAAFGELTHRSFAVTDAAGGFAGSLAAELADLSAGQRLDAPSRR